MKEIKKDTYSIGILVVLFLISGVIFMFYSIETYDFEECFQTSLTKDILRNNLDPKELQPPLFANFQLPLYMGGSTIFGLAAIPFSLLFGFSNFVFKIVALFFSSILLVFFYFFIKRFFNRKIAVIASLLMVFTPPTYMLRSLVFIADSPYTFLFVLFSMFFFFKIFLSKDKKEYNNKNFFLLGLTIAIAIWFSYTSLVMLLLYFIIWFIHDKKFFIKKTFLFFMLGFFIGFIPWLYHNATTSFLGIEQLIKERQLIIEKRLIEQVDPYTPTNILYRPLYLAVHDLPNSFQFKNLFFIKGSFFNYAYFLFFLISCFSILFKYKKNILDIFKTRTLQDYKFKRILFILSYILLFLLVYVVSGYRVESLGGTSDCCTRWCWYMLPIFPFIFIVISVFLYNLYISHRKKVFLFSFVVLISMILLGNVGSFSKTSMFPILNSECSVFSIYNVSGIDEAEQEPISNLNQLTAICNSMEEKERSSCYRAAGKEFYLLFGREGAIRKCKQIPEPYTYLCYQGINH